MKEKELSLDWIAGFFDGEGSVSISIRKDDRRNHGSYFGFYFDVRIRIGQKNPEILTKIQRFLGFGFTSGSEFVVRKHDDIKRFIELIGSRSLVKKEEIDLMAKTIPLLSHRGSVYIPKENAEKILGIIERLHKIPSRKGKVPYQLLGYARQCLANWNESDWRARKSDLARRGWVTRRELAACC